MPRSSSIAYLLVAALAGCSASVGGPEALFQQLSVGDVNGLPWPSDAILGPDGKLLVQKPFPFDSAIEENLTQLAKSLSEADGFGTTTSIFFPVTADLELDAGATATVVDLEDPSLTLQYPLFYRAETKQLVAMSPRGTVLKEHHPYACWVTEGVHDAQGRKLQPAENMRDVLAGRGPVGLKGAYGKLAPLLTSRKLSPLAATAFTTQTLTGWVPKVIADLEAMPPKATLPKVWKGDDLDELFGGVATTTRPGRPLSGGVLHDQIELVVFGTFDGPHYLSETPGTLGLFDAANSVKATDHIPFVLVLPKRPAAGYGQTPVLIFQHGINDDRRAVLEVANSFAARGFAVIGIDELWHGSRRPAAVDLLNNLSGEMHPDGIGDPEAAGAIKYFFDIVGDQARNIAPFDPRYIRDNFRQATVDLMQLVRFARHGDLKEVAAADPALADLSLDGSKLVFIGESFGSILGAQVLALEPELEAGVFDVGGGGLGIDLVPSSAQFGLVFQPFLDGAFDLSLDFNHPDVLPPHAQMSITMLQTVLEEGDGLSLAGPSPLGKQVLFIEALNDETVANQACEALAFSYGASQVKLARLSVPTHILELPEVAAPYTAPTVHALVQLDPATHVMFTQQHGQQAYQPPFPPFVKRAQPIAVDNPIEIVHALAA